MTGLLDRDPTDAGVTPAGRIAAALAQRASTTTSTAGRCTHGNSAKRTASGEPVCVQCWRAADRRRDPRPGRLPDHQDQPHHHDQEDQTA